ncbi:hypothetical protein AKJ09_07983 [Labilithrix luteola]|uniref:Uncharacterized protein n=1 Tax=Labilithrix luteola TaxID=1391654 RepID=A0A0K1Q7E9_9BACT|nr:hypothetical protein AKJ09_07983 [Labilithrix luteola]
MSKRSVVPVGFDEKTLEQGVRTRDGVSGRRDGLPPPA